MPDTNTKDSIVVRSMVECGLCGGYYLEDPAHPGFPDAHKCFRAVREVSAQPDEQTDDQSDASLDEQTNEPMLEPVNLGGGEEIDNTVVTRDEIMRPPACPHCGHVPARPIAQEILMGNLQCLVFSCADCRKIINMQCVGQVNTVIQPDMNARVPRKMTTQ